MIRAILLPIAALFAVTVPPTAVQSPTPLEAVRLLKVDAEHAQTTPAFWNGKQTVFVDFPAKADEAGDMGLQVYAVQRSGGRLIKIKVTEGEPEGGDPEVAAIGFANADRDSAKELIVILEWPQKHYDYEGRFLEVRLLDDIRPGKTALAPLAKLSKHFGFGCECYYRDGRKPEHYRFKTIVSVQRELRRLGY